MSTANSARLIRALGLSLLAHGLVLAASGRPSLITPAALSAFEPIAVTLTSLRLPPSAQPPRAAANPASAPVAPPSRTTEAAAAPEASAAADTTVRDEPFVEARSDVATLNNPKPPYPLAARRRGIEGRVLLAVQVLADGSCAEVQLKRSSGHPQLDDAALSTVRRWRFLPAERAGVAIDSWAEVPISFRLNG